MQSHETGQTEVGDEMQKSQTVVAGLGVERAERRCVEKNVVQKCKSHNGNCACAQAGRSETRIEWSGGEFKAEPGKG